MHRVQLSAQLRATAVSCSRIREQGAALILVVWIATLLLAIAGSFLYATRTDARAMRNLASLARADAIAHAAVSRAMLELLKPAGLPGVWRRGPVPRDWSFEGAAVRLTLTDESAKIDINFASTALLSSLLQAAGMNADEAARALDAILDWRDADSLRRPNGAEEQEYIEAGVAWRPANQPFQSIEELQLVLGINPDAYSRIAPMVTLYSRLPGVNPFHAPRSVLLALPGVTAEQVDAYLREREAAYEAGLQPPAFSAAAGYASYGPVNAVTVRADVQLDDGVSVAREAVAVITPQYPRRPFALLAWRDAARAQAGRASGGALGR